MKSQINNLASQRLVWLDALKGIGILLIMACHAGLLPRVSIFLTAGYVSIFFVASGFTYKSKQTFSSEIGKRSKRLLLPYFFYVSLSIILMNIFQIKGDFIHQVLGMIYSRYSLYFGIKDVGDVSLLTQTCNSPTWFLTALFTSLMVMYIIKSLKWQWVVITCLGLSVLTLYLPFLLPWSLDTAFVGALFIYLGKKIRGGQFWIPNGKTWLGCFVIYAVVVFLEKTNNISVRQYGVHEPFSILSYLFIGVMETLLLVYLFVKFEKTILIKLLAYVGRMSLVLMCVHAPLIVIFKKNLCSTCNLNDSVVVLAALVFAFVIAYFIQMLSHKINKPIVSNILGV